MKSKTQPPNQAHHNQTRTIGTMPLDKECIQHVDVEGGNASQKVPDIESPGKGLTIPLEQWEKERTLWEHEKASLIENIQRIAAEFDNFKKRLLKEASQAKIEASRDIIESLLPVLDHFELAIKHFPGEPEGKEKGEDNGEDNGKNKVKETVHITENRKESREESQKEIGREGMELMYTQLLSILEKQGLSKMEAEGKLFDPRLHEALLSEPASNPGKKDHEKNKIIEVIQSGYLLHGIMIRTAKVKIRA